MMGPDRLWMLLSALFLCAGLLATTGCSPKYVKGTKVEYSEEKQALADVVERYRMAMETRDVEALRRLASRDYYENASTTTDPSDDYGYQGLERVFADIENTVKEVRYTIDIKSIDVLGDAATVDYEYTGQYLFTVGERDRWETVTDKNRLTLRREEGDWRIVNGM